MTGLMYTYMVIVKIVSFLISRHSIFKYIYAYICIGSEKMWLFQVEKRHWSWMRKWNTGFFCIWFRFLKKVLHYCQSNVFSHYVHLWEYLIEILMKTDHQSFQNNILKQNKTKHKYLMAINIVWCQFSILWHEQSRYIRSLHFLSRDIYCSRSRSEQTSASVEVTGW